MLCSCPSTHRVPRRPTSKGLRLLVTSVWQTGTEIFTNVNSTAWFRIRPSSIHSNTCWTKDLLAVTKLSLQNEALAKVPTWDYSAACSGLWSITHTILSLTPLTHPHFLLHYEGLSIDISCHISRSHLFSSSDTHLHCESIISLLSLLIRLCLWFCAPLKHPITAQSLQIHQLHQPSSLRRVIFRRHHYRRLDPVGEFSWLLLRAEPPRSQNLPEESKCQRLSDKTRISQHLL